MSDSRFSWSLTLAGAAAAAAVTFLLLTLGAGVGLLFVHPTAAGMPQGFFTGGAIYFFVAQAFGFAVGGHVAGRLLGPMVESHEQEEIRAAIHGLTVWAVAVLATLAVTGLTGQATAALYGIVNAGDAGRRAASFVSLWTAFALAFGAIVAMVAAITARLADDQETPWGLWAFHKTWRN